MHQVGLLTCRIDARFSGQGQSPTHYANLQACFSWGCDCLIGQDNESWTIKGNQLWLICHNLNWPHVEETQNVGSPFRLSSLTEAV